MPFSWHEKEHRPYASLLDGARVSCNGRTAAGIALLVVALCWLPPAEAFFCFSFGGNGKSSSNHAFGRSRLPPPPPPILAPHFINRPRLERRQVPKAVAPADERPVVIEGYRFRPLEREPQAEQLTPAVHSQK
ncbi:MAG: hypothetical protein KME56_18585 [Candidatus Thiodiazotropha sp. (ex Ctena orbiculata)]|uniref:Uncharacterized protein n=1 Tax=Candidatus Thiodiazotropha taylori TaxID=2792791 RepID=A0A944M7P7_9GAMM|nr:hypothetical protein [Candidatus Thiodiazotropha taylori]MBT2988769.1 hypothetical protein [Candidatus Thiodiazotropha taylori]MBT2998620.1 hypothetical protein [Candidatus Thiodiazotropha taylori]MBT3001464.1 hypothetical protein [Candidatus Thiodiazotropha taylori]MBT3027267.1 hypothetical protein [Candidatus Thiodiazotropha taylori]